MNIFSPWYSLIFGFYYLEKKQRSIIKQILVTGKVFHDGYLEYHRSVEEKKGTATEIKENTKINEQKSYDRTFLYHLADIEYYINASDCNSKVNSGGGGDKSINNL